jgi:hypothetical protein
MTIDIKQFQTPGAKVLSGRPKGQEVRQKLCLDQVDVSPELINVLVPEEILTINSSFFLGLFGDSVRKLGENGFLDHYRFSVPERIWPDIRSGIADAMRTSNPLAMGKK